MIQKGIFSESTCINLLTENLADRHSENEYGSS